MPIIDLYSNRNTNPYPDIYKYDSIPRKLRVQLLKIIFDTYGAKEDYYSGGLKYGSSAHVAFNDIFDILSKEYGLTKIRGWSFGCHGWVEEMILKENFIENFLDLLEVLCTYALNVVQPEFNKFRNDSHAKQLPSDAIEEINERMKRAGVGYEYVDGIIMRIDKAFTHAEITKPALFFLSEFEGAKQEFLNAHEHYRHKRYEECLTEANKSLESLLKHICDNEGWAYSKGTINALIPICMSNGLIPSYLQTQLSSLPTLISQGISSIRNNESGHGQGSSLRELPEHLVSYSLHLTASNILFLGSSYKKYKDEQ